MEAAMWTTQQILALAPDESSVKAGQSLASLSKWVSVSRDDRILWGECQGSGSKPYQVQVDLSEPAFKCSCPSRKFPCKHALGLMMMLAPGANQPARSRPQWVVEWVIAREEKARKKAEAATSGPTALSDPEAQQRRTADRMARAANAIADLDTFLEDMVRHGLSQVQSAGIKYAAQPAARMVDNQAPGLARLIGKIPGLAAAGPHWQECLLAHISRMYLVGRAFQRLESLPVELQADVKAFLGHSVREQDLATLPAINDIWTVVGQRTEEEDRLRAQRTWLLGWESRRCAMVLNFAYSGTPMKDLLAVGNSSTADIVFYPGRYPMRATIRSRQADWRDVAILPGYADFDAALDAYAGALAQTPWLEQFPILLKGAIPWQFESFLLLDARYKKVPIQAPAELKWKMLALSGGHPVDVFGEWDGHSLTVMGMLAEGGYHELN